MVKKMKTIDRHIYFYEEHIKVLEEIIKTQVGVGNYSEAVRFLCMTYNKDTPNKSGDERAKLNAIGKEVSILSVLVGELAAYQILEEDILGGTESKAYLKAKTIVEDQIKRNQTKKYSSKKGSSVRQMNLMNDPFRDHLDQSK